MAVTRGRLRLNHNQKQAAIAAAWFLLTMVSIVATLMDAGLTWDEPLYIKASRGYMTWLGILRRDVGQALSDGTIVRWWVQDPTLELHPPLGKFLSGLSWAAFRGLLGDIAAHRLSNALLFSLLVAAVFWMVSSMRGTASGMFAALSLILMPRMFFHAHLANIDTTVAITWFLAMYAFWGLESRPGWLPVAIAGLFYGLALATKMNAVVMPLVWGIWVLLFRRNLLSILRLGVVSAIGVVVFVVTWPWLYHDTANRLLYYVLMASRFKDRPQFYLGQALPHVPWHYPFVITLAVVPLVITVMYLLGTVQVARRRPADAWGWLLIINALTPLIFAATGLQAAYSGERHFIPAYPYLACLAGIGFASALDVLGARAAQLYEWLNHKQVRWGAAMMLAVLFLPALISMVQIHPYELSYYSELVGGLRGATRLGLETTFWCETYQDVLPYLNANAEQGASVWAENPFVLRLYQGSGMLRQDLQATGGDVVSPLTADYVVVQMRQTAFAYYTPDVVDLMQIHDPVYSLTRQGIPLLHLYELAEMG
jgi:4-amino-4-deoxy-L-arabinose transferase-like glycosyltransferase